MFIDTHCHIDELNEKEVIKYLENAQKNDVEKLIISGVDLESSKKVIDLSNKYSNIYCTIGIHPNNIAN
ncbi:MAG: TatD family hydrolase, partial [Bacilli bacterium]